MTGIQAFLQILAGAGVTHLFGNPGTTELPLLDALADDHRFKYILGLQEVPVVAMADGYALASGKLGVVNVHVSCGLGNSMGMLYNAFIEGSPLLLTAGQVDRRLRMEEPVLEGDLVGVTRPWTKWSHEVQRVQDVPAAVRRAVKTALTPPTGPVFLSLPLDLQSEQCDRLDTSPPVIPDRRVRPPLEALRQAFEMLRMARNPAILAGCRVTESGGIAELVALAEQLGATVFSEAGTMHGRLPFPVDHFLYAGSLPLWSPDAHRRLMEFDVMLVVGTNLPRQYLYHEPPRVVPDHVRLIHLDNDAWQIGKNYAVEVGLLGDPKTGLDELHSMLARRQNESDRGEAFGRWTPRMTAREEVLRALRADMESQRDRRPMTPLTVMGAVERVFPANGAVIEEAVTTTNMYLERLGAIKDPTGYFGHRGWALGWGLGCAMGVKLAWPERPVLALLGEGSAMYGIQGLWSAAHHRIPVTFVICNNAQYQILKACAAHLPLPQMSAGKFLAMDLVQPEIDFVGLSKSMGVEAYRVSTPDELSDRLRTSLAGDRPILLDVPVARQGTWGQSGS